MVLRRGSGLLAGRGSVPGERAGGIAMPVPQNQNRHSTGRLSRLEGTANEDARRDHLRTQLRRPLRHPGRWAPRGHGVVQEVHRRLPHQHRGGARPAGDAVRGHHPGRRRAHGTVHPRAARPRGGGRAGGEDGSGTLDRPRPPRDPRRPAVPPHLLPRRLRRHGALGGRHRPRLHRRGAELHGDRDAPEPPTAGGGSGEGASARPRERRPDRPRHRLPAEPLGGGGARRR